LKVYSISSPGPSSSIIPAMNLRWLLRHWDLWVRVSLGISERIHFDGELMVCLKFLRCLLYTPYAAGN
jgi:hypothetical protein